MPLPSLSPGARRAWIALAIALPLASLASLAGAALWVRDHGGLAANLTQLARKAAFVAGRLDGVPVALAVAHAVALDDRCPASGGVWMSSSGTGRDGHGFSFALVEPGDGASFSFNSGESGRTGELDRLRRSADVPTVWFAQSGVEYVVTDRATVEKARALCEPLRELGAEMGRVGAEQGRIGARMGRYGGRIGALGGRLGGLSARLAVARMSDSERERLASERDELRAEIERVRAEMETHDRGESPGREDLSRRMRELSQRHESELDRVRAELRKLLDEARARGKAERLGRST